MLFWRYCKDMQTYYFRFFGHAWLHTPKMMLSTSSFYSYINAFTIDINKIKKTKTKIHLPSGV